MIEHTRKQVEDIGGYLSCADVRELMKARCALENSIDELADAYRDLQRAYLYDFCIDQRVEDLKKCLNEVENVCCECGKPLDKHAEEPEEL